MLDVSMKATGVKDQFNFEDIEIEKNKVYQHIMTKKDGEESKKRNKKFEAFVSSMNLDEIISKEKSKSIHIEDKPEKSLLEQKRENH